MDKKEKAKTSVKIVHRRPIKKYTEQNNMVNRFRECEQDCEPDHALDLRSSCEPSMLIFQTHFSYSEDKNNMYVKTRVVQQQKAHVISKQERN